MPRRLRILDGTGSTVGSGETNEATICRMRPTSPSLSATPGAAAALARLSSAMPSTITPPAVFAIAATSLARPACRHRVAEKLALAVEVVGLRYRVGDKIGDLPIRTTSSRAPKRRSSRRERRAAMGPRS